MAEGEAARGVRIAVVGSGLAGLAAASHAAAAGATVTVLEAADRIGGRLASVNRDGCSFDAGAQYFTARDPRFRRALAGWLRAGAATRWRADLVSLSDGRAHRRPDTTRRYVGVPDMAGIARVVAAAIDVRIGTRVTAARRRDGWVLETDAAGTLTGFDAVVLALTPGRAAPLLDDVPLLAAAVQAVDMRPCWAVLAGFDKALPLDFDGAFLRDGVLSWAGRNNTKPGRPAGEAWTLHADHGWSSSHGDLSNGRAAEQLLSAFAHAAGCRLPGPAVLDAHLWPEATARAPLDDGCLADDDAAVAVCGDWCAGSRVEGAYVSGLAAADRVMTALAVPGSGGSAG